MIRNWTAVTVGAIVTIVLTGCAGYRPMAHASWDAKIRDLCNNHGGVVVYERVNLDRAEHRLLGGRTPVSVPRRQSASSNIPYVTEEKITWISEQNPRVYRADVAVVRTRDSKVLSRMVSFGRIGGDLVSPYSCQDAGIRLDLEQQTFVTPPSIND